ncbi:unnamed protein product, partial [marine sediment metagenome]
GLPIIIIRSFNNYGPNQYPEKMIPLFITNALEDKKLPIYGDGTFSRDWLFVEDHCKALDKVMRGDLKKLKGEVINLGTGVDTDINTIAKMILDRLGKSQSLLQFVQDRSGHVQRHVASNAKAKILLGWAPNTDLNRGLNRTVDWYVKNEEWWRKLRTPDIRTSE